MRSTSIKGVKVEEGQAIAIVDDELAQAATTPEDVFRNTLSSLSLRRQELDQPLLRRRHDGAAGERTGRRTDQTLSEP